MLFGIHDRWPAFVRPKEDELLPSWLLRSSHAHQVKAHTFCKIVWPQLAFWNRDIDRLAPPAVWQLLAYKTGAGLERSYQTTLAAYEGLLFRRAVSHGNSFWILALGIYHRTHTRHGTQFCPSCLRIDGRQPYYRRWWRLALAVGCPACGCQLLDECPFCKQPIIFHRSEIGRKNELATYPLSCCANCYADLTDLQTPALPPPVLRLQREWHARLTTPGAASERYEYFDVLHQLGALLVSKKPSLLNFQRAVAADLGIAFCPPTGGYRNRLEALRLAERTHVIRQVAGLLDEWPTRFLALVRHTNTRLSAVLSEPEHLPASFMKLVLGLKEDGTNELS